LQACVIVIASPSEAIQDKISAGLFRRSRSSQ
jgi:hypothetical protein